MIEDLLKSWSFRIGVFLLLPIFLFVPWRQELLWDTGGGVVVPIEVVRYGFIWNRPLEAGVDLVRLFTEIILLAVAVAIAFQFERARLSR
ncbi:MAG: hypothetical protein GWN99_04595 [Gemmatimonadetes bacterium]|uniref:Uncharacterized protein n=1 Tax=Candidatus Kutchimonas denitrificans TaxID=3056748 RepID=A0AAE4Z8E4_9BACT|nr:hypothetical protein [Gemmatimonadota bacterium]NIR75729.1 hypothetical protein [Candidatus Kutchimonas denitrificans]NIS00342.1 hypothetical protein [Gemmatimonadota bacterium]NIT66001.1 hypothetical protein [Gemmatimonadota bacterium]NIU53705.1 hypothetical protein [Gemmatimonadota bacterium]